MTYRDHQGHRCGLSSPNLAARYLPEIVRRGLMSKRVYLVEARQRRLERKRGAR